MANPVYITLSATGSSPWKLVNWQCTPVNLGIAITATSLTANWQIDVTMDDPTQTAPGSPATQTVFQASQVSGPAGSSVNAIGSITQPIAAWRLTNNSTGGNVRITVIQAGLA